MKQQSTENQIDKIVSSLCITATMFFVIALAFIFDKSMMLNIDSEIVRLIAFIDLMIIYFTLHKLDINLLEKIEKIF